MFNDYCDKWLDIGKLDKHKDGEGNILTKDYFFLIFKSVIFWKKMWFEETREDLTRQRRKAYFGGKQPDLDAYKQVIKKENQLEAKCMQAVLEKVLAKVGITEDIFEENFKFYSKD